MIDNYQKYTKYKTKYIKSKDMKSNDIKSNDIKSNDIIQSGGNKSSDLEQNKFNKIINFIKKSKKEVIQKELYNMIQDKKYCSNILASGAFGNVYIPMINNTFQFKISKKNIEFPIVVKETKNINRPEMYSGIDIIDNKLYISGTYDMTTEVLIHMFIRKLWYQTVHLPLMFAYGTCSNSNSKIVDKIITLRYGLEEPINIDMTGKIHHEGMRWSNRHQDTDIIKSSIATMTELFIYMRYNKNKDGSVKLPNGQKCYVSEVFDYMCISYMATCQLLTKNNIIPSDMKGANIFIHWLHDSKIPNYKNLKEIVYKIGKKYYKIKTFGFIIILGDVGTFIISVRNDVILVGHAFNIKKNYKLIEMRARPEFANMDFIWRTKNMLSQNEYINTIAFKIVNTEPYCSYPYEFYYMAGALDMSYLNALKSTVELLSFFDEKYGINKYTKNKTNILIDVKKYNI
jgi:hypothetical protein